jgi:TolB-like protein
MPDLPTSAPSLPIFLSYASEDAAAARRIAEVLGRAGLVVWFDQSELRGGDAWDQRIRRQIKECALFMPVISAHTQARAEGYFRLEWHLAEQRSYLMAQSKVFIVPVVVDETPDANALVPDRFRERQWTRLPQGQVPFDFAPRIAQLLGDAIPAPRQAPPETRVAAAPTAGERSVAVLAFANLSNDQENEYFSEGVSDELLTVLQNVPGLRVAARTSAFSFRGKNVPVREIGAQLDVAHLVEGGVQKLGNRVKVAARLTAVSTGVVKWSRSYTREIQDAFALQEELALAIVGELRGQLAGDEAALVQQANRGGTRVPAAYESYLLGKHLYEQFSEGPVTQAAMHLRRATELDPEFALAWIYFANVQVWRCSYLGSLTREEFDTALADARRAVERGLSLEPDLGSGLAVRGFIQLVFDFDAKAAAATLRRAEQLAPNDPAVLQLSSQLMYMARTAAEAVQLGRRIVARDPINARPHFVLAWALAEGGLFDEARVEAARFRDLNPTAVMADVAVAYILAMEGRYAEAERALQPSPARWPELWMRGIICHGLGRTAESDAALDEMTRRFSAAGAVQIAQIHAFRGESDLAFQWFDRARQQRDPGVMLMARSVFFRNIRGDPRWVAFWRELGIEAADRL